METVGGRSCYVTKPSNGSKAKTAIFLSDIFGLYNNAFLVADTWAAAGYYVYIPDIFDGELERVLAESASVFAE